MNKYEVRQGGGSSVIRRHITPNEYLTISSWEEEKGRYQKWEIEEGLPLRLRKGFADVFRSKEVFEYWDIRSSGGKVEDCLNKPRLWEILEEIGAEFTVKLHRFGVFLTIEEQFWDKIGELQLVVSTGGLHKCKQFLVRGSYNLHQPTLEEILGEPVPEDRPTKEVH
jgi:hypothetical protein